MSQNKAYSGSQSSADILRQYFGITDNPPGAGAPTCLRDGGIYGYNFELNSAFGRTKFNGDFLPPPNQKFYNDIYNSRNNSSGLIGINSTKNKPIRKSLRKRTSLKKLKFGTHKRRSFKPSKRRSFKQLKRKTIRKSRRRSFKK